MKKEHPEKEKIEKHRLHVFLNMLRRNHSGITLGMMAPFFEIMRREKKKREKRKQRFKYHHCRVVGDFQYRYKFLHKGLEGSMRKFLPKIVYHSPIGPIVLSDEGGFLVSAQFLNLVEEKEIKTFQTPVLEQAVRELDEYFAGKRMKFDVPMKLNHKTIFQSKVWNQLKKIRYGKTVSYSQLARRIGESKAARAVGMANRCNPLVIFIPCHRVIRSDGSLSGYAGGVEAKRFLLELEKKVLREKKDVLRKKRVDETGN